MKARVYHVQVNVRDAAVSLPFWKALLGYLEYRIVHEECDVAGFSNGTTDLWLIATDQAHTGAGFHRKRAGLNHVAFRVERREDVDRFRREFLEARGVPTLYGTPRDHRATSPCSSKTRIGSSSRWPMFRRAASLAAAALLLWAAGGTAATKTYRSAEWGFEFAYPDQFAAGRYKDTLTPELQARLRETGQEPPFKHAIALVEPARLGSRAPLDALPVGEIATITVTPARGQKADFYRRQLFRKEWETVVAGWTIYKLPGYPGPYGDTAFYYLLPLRDDLVVETFAHRRHMDQARTDTGYDRVIEGMIATFKTFPPGG